MISRLLGRVHHISLQLQSDKFSRFLFKVLLSKFNWFHYIAVGAAGSISMMMSTAPALFFFSCIQVSVHLGGGCTS
jgi:hypothetical protein